MKLLIADSGGTKTDWAYITPSGINYFSGEGLHPAYNSSGQIGDELRKNVLKNVGEVDHIWFYGAGCYGSEPVSKIKQSIIRVFPESAVNVFDDLTGAARAHLQNRNGTICAMGTGSICGRYKNGEIVRRSAALGFAIGDEGSAADIGRAILKAFFRDEMGEETSSRVASVLQNREYAYWMDKIYKSPHPNRELASVAGKVLEKVRSKQLLRIITGCFERFLDQQLSSIKPDKQEPIVLTGTVANKHSSLLSALLTQRGFTSHSVSSGVIGGLVEYHAKR
ncbi:hypothetical protein DYD21_15755 [Rhodohalobacter sp. SW132]|uniref:hypothetical protein n=1 Tax=Rhodohalobacter sp. SW132 TaxID=2293433 RepID=UPI000E280A8F|nr:hypothetical protein [Rhodohalobacter sp. SW132]REL24976.1 hypothetical protein DYD21_15755 [Rhodohalobacter sp. SW132]